ncbi:putative transcription regulator protein of MDR efflux pump cluster [Candidatus Burkholderia humilis]|nr:putative transcription regulator protein of MDR efflux pump cluster [Candidatus Burkholderia humilis]
MDRQVDFVEEAIDCVVRVGAIGDVGLVAKRIGAYSQITCASPGYIDQYGEPMALDDLEQHLAIGYVLNKSGRVRNWEFDVDGESRVFAMKHKIAVNDGDSYIAAGVAGLGLIQSSSYTLNPLLRSGKLVEVLKDYPSHARVVSVLYAANRHQPRRVRVFIDWVAELYSRLPIFQEKASVAVVSS